MKVVLSMGGGQESSAVLGLVLKDPRFAALRPDHVVFSDLGAEWPETYEQLRFVEAICASQGIEYARIVPEVFRGKKIFGENRRYTKLYDYLHDVKVIPGKAPNGKRLCTELFKVEAIRKHLIERFGGEEMTILIGFGADEESRIKRGENKIEGWTNRFPLHEAGLCRCRSIEYLRSIGWPVPRRSGCTFCPFSKKLDFQIQKDVYPEAFAQSVALEANNRRFNDPEKPIRIAGKKSVAEWVETPTPRRRRVCGVCARDVDMALHTFGDTPLYARYQEMRKEGACA